MQQEMRIEALTSELSITDSKGRSPSKLRDWVMDREAWRAAVPGVAKSQTWLSDWRNLRKTMVEEPQIVSETRFSPSSAVLDA